MEVKFIDNENIIVELFENRELYSSYSWEDYCKAAIELGVVSSDYFEDIDICEYADDSHNYTFVEEGSEKYLCVYNTWADGQGGIMILWDANTKEAIASSYLEGTQSMQILPAKKLILEGCIISNYITPPKPLVLVYPFKKVVKDNDKKELNIRWELSEEEFKAVRNLVELEEKNSSLKVYLKDDKYYFVLGEFYGVLSKEEFENIL